MKEGEEIVKCEVCGHEMPKSKARSYGQSDATGRYVLHWICPIMESPNCYVALLLKLTHNVPMSFYMEAGR